MAVPLSGSGEHRLILRYRPQIVYLAATITAATWIIVLVATAAGAALARRPQRG
jgi:hypothetical protein